MTQNTSVPLGRALQMVKGRSSKWVYDTYPQLPFFAWQRGYSAFSVSASYLDANVNYIKNQREHHRTKTFREEFIAFLEKHRLNPDESIS